MEGVVAAFPGESGGGRLLGASAGCGGRWSGYCSGGGHLSGDDAALGQTQTAFDDEMDGGGSS